MHLRLQLSSLKLKIEINPQSGSGVRVQLIDHWVIHPFLTTIQVPGGTPLILDHREHIYDIVTARCTVQHQL